MSAGAQITAAEINNRAAAVARMAFAVMAEIDKFGTFMAATPDLTLTGTYSYPAGDVPDLRSATNDLVELAKIFRGQTSPRVTGTYDFTTFTKRLIGAGVY